MTNNPSPIPKAALSQTIRCSLCFLSNKTSGDSSWQDKSKKSYHRVGVVHQVQLRPHWSAPPVYLLSVLKPACHHTGLVNLLVLKTHSSVIPPKWANRHVPMEWASVEVHQRLVCLTVRINRWAIHNSSRILT